MDAPLPHVICPHCGAENPHSPIVTMCSKCFGSLDGAKPAAPAAPAADGPVPTAPVTTIALSPSSAPVPPVPMPPRPPDAPTTPAPPPPPAPQPPPPPSAGAQSDLDIQLAPPEPELDVTLEPPSDAARRQCPACGHWMDPLDRQCLYCGRIKTAAEPQAMATGESHPSASVGAEPPPRPGNVRPGCGCRLFIFLIVAFLIFRPDRILRINPGEMVAWVVVAKPAERGTDVYVRDVVWPVGQPEPMAFEHLGPGVAERIRSAFAASAVDPTQVRMPPPAARPAPGVGKSAAPANQRPPAQSVQPTGGGEKRLLCRLRWAGLFEPALYDFTVCDPAQEGDLRAHGPH